MTTYLSLVHVITPDDLDGTGINPPLKPLSRCMIGEGIAIRSGAAEMEAGSAEASAGGGSGADSAPSPLSSWTILGGGEVALGGCP